MEELIRQAPIIVAIVYAIVLLVRQTPAWSGHPVWDGYVPLASALLVVVLTVVLVVTRDLDVDVIDILSVVFVTALGPTGLHEARKSAATVVTGDLNE